MDTLFSQMRIGLSLSMGTSSYLVSFGSACCTTLTFVQTEYFKEAEADHRSGAIQKLVPRALWWFRWGAAFTFLTGLYLLYRLSHRRMSYDILVGATLGHTNGN